MTVPRPPACYATAISTCVSRRYAHTRRSLRMTNNGKQGGKRKEQEGGEHPEWKPDGEGDQALPTWACVRLYVPTGEEGAARASPSRRAGQAVPCSKSSLPDWATVGPAAAPPTTPSIGAPAPLSPALPACPSACGGGGAGSDPGRFAHRAVCMVYTCYAADLPCFGGEWGVRGGSSFPGPPLVHALQCDVGLGRFCPVGVTCVEDTALILSAASPKTLGISQLMA